MYVYTIEGNIGSGKSTLLKHLKEVYKNDPNVIFIDEPVDEWMATKDASGENILEKYYADQIKYGFSFQMLAYITKLKLLRSAYYTHRHNPHVTLISERSLYTDRHVFAEMLYDSGKIEDINYAIYLNWFNYFINELEIKHQIIYVKTAPEICSKRITERNRGGESNIPLEYLENCHKYHKKMIYEELSTTPVCLIDGDTHKDCGVMPNCWEDDVGKIRMFMARSHNTPTLSYKMN